MDACITGWGHTRFGRLEGGTLESLITAAGATGVSMHVLAARQLAGQAGEMRKPGAELGCAFKMGGPAVADYVSALEPIGAGS